MNEEETTKRFYELGYLITPTTPETEVSAEVETLKKSIEAAQGTIHSEGAPEFIDLAYTMEKNVASKKMKWSQAYFGWIKFEAAPEALATLKKELDGNLALIRYILIKTNVENTIVFKKPKVDAKREVYLSEEEMNALIAEAENSTEETDEPETPHETNDATIVPQATVESEEKE